MSQIPPGSHERDSQRIAYLTGRYDMCSLLLTSPRMNRPQRDVITDQAMTAKDELEALGVRFSEDEEDTDA